MFSRYFNEFCCSGGDPTTELCRWCWRLVQLEVIAAECEENGSLKPRLHDTIVGQPVGQPIVSCIQRFDCWTNGWMKGWMNQTQFCWNLAYLNWVRFPVWNSVFLLLYNDLKLLDVDMWTVERLIMLLSSLNVPNLNKISILRVARRIRETYACTNAVYRVVQRSKLLHCGL